jgi:hypothetical protein
VVDTRLPPYNLNNTLSSGGAMFSVSYLLFCILLLMSLGAVIAFSYFVIKPLQTRWAIARARKIIASGCLPDGRHYRNVYRLLATAHHDLEAAKLWRQLDEMKEAPTSLNNRVYRQLVAIIPPDGKL